MPHAKCSPYLLLDHFWAFGPCLLIIHLSQKRAEITHFVGPIFSTSSQGGFCNFCPFSLKTTSPQTPKNGNEDIFGCAGSIVDFIRDHPNLYIDQAKEIVVLWALEVKWQPGWWNFHSQHDCLCNGRVVTVSRWWCFPWESLKKNFRTFWWARLSIHERNDWHGHQAFQWRIVYKGAVWTTY